LTKSTRRRLKAGIGRTRNQEIGDNYAYERFKEERIEYTQMLR